MSGRVQGVWYRDTARQEAERLGVAGSAANRLDGRVVLEAEGEEAAVEAFLAWAAEGPPRARVDTVSRRSDRTHRRARLHRHLVAAGRGSAA